jgi:hypothetical protein
MGVFEEFGRELWTDCRDDQGPRRFQQLGKLRIVRLTVIDRKALRRIYADACEVRFRRGQMTSAISSPCESA